MQEQLSKFERESTKAPVWLPIAGVIMFFIVMIVAITCPGDPPTLPDGGVESESGSSE